MCCRWCVLFFFFSSRRRHTRWPRDWSSDVCSSDLRGRRSLVPPPPQADRSRDVLGLDALGSREIGDGPRYPQHAVISPAAQPELGVAALERAARLAAELRRAAELGQVHVGVAAPGAEAELLALAGGDDACPDARRVDAATRAHLLRGRTIHRHGDVDAVREGAAQLRPVTARGGGPALALPGFLAAPARTRIRSGEQHEAARQLNGPAGTGDRDAPLLERLAQRLERLARELPQLVKEEHAAVRERDLARPRRRPAAHQAGG